MQAADLQAAEKTRPRFRHSPHDFVIPSKARNLSFLSPAQPSERFLASLGMTKITTFSATWWAAKLWRLWCCVRDAPRGVWPLRRRGVWRDVDVLARCARGGPPIRDCPLRGAWRLRGGAGPRVRGVRPLFDGALPLAWTCVLLVLAIEIRWCG